MFLIERGFRIDIYRGVVQLFNAVAERQRVLAEELSKKMSAKERRETVRRLEGSSFRVFPENGSDGVEKVSVYNVMVILL